MPEQVITCPKCGTKIPLSDAFTHEIEEKLHAQLELEMKKKDREHQEALVRERARLEQQAKRHAEEASAVELKDMKDQLEEKSRQLESARQQELDLRKGKRELEERERNITLELDRKLDAERKRIWEEAGRKLAEDQRLKEAEKDKQLSDMRRQIEELKRKSELTSQQAQGEVLELELETILAQNFRSDGIEPVAKGVRGADIVQRVRDEAGRQCGTIIWESKRTKAWSDAWVQKLKDDQRAAKAELAVIVSAVLPKDVNRFGNYEGIWVADFESALGLATALRANLIEVTRASSSLQGKNDKMELIYAYLSGTGFKQRVEAIVESFVSLKSDLEAEKRSMEKIWAKRDAQIERVIKSTAGMYGDLQGIIGSALPEVKLLELPPGNRDGS